MRTSLVVKVVATSAPTTLIVLGFLLIFVNTGYAGFGEVMVLLGAVVAVIEAIVLGGRRRQASD